MVTFTYYNLINTHIFSKYIYVLYVFSPHLAKISTKFFFKHDKLISKLIWQCKKDQKKSQDPLKEEQENARTCFIRYEDFKSPRN